MPPSSETFKHIPQEILDIIINHAKNDPNTLCNLCLVSTSSLPEAQRLLYHNINISDDSAYALYSGWLIDFTKATQLLITLTEHNSTLAQHIQSLYHRLINQDHYNDDHYWSLLKRSLLSMTNLTNLNITCTNRVSNLFADCPFRKLTVFADDRPHSCSDTYHDTMHLLTAQPDLKSLYVWRMFLDDHNQPFPKDCCPKLEALSGDRRTIENILPGRGGLITRLTWIPDSGEDVDSPPHSIASELSNIRVFAFGGFYRRANLRLFVPYLSSLEVLRLYGESIRPDIFIELGLIPELPNLRIFIWTAGFATSVKWNFFEGRLSQEKQHRLTKEWFSQSPTLQKAYFHTRVPKAGPQVYLCWKRDADEPTRVGSEEAVTSHGVVTWYS